MVGLPGFSESQIQIAGPKVGRVFLNLLVPLHRRGPILGGLGIQGLSVERTDFIRVTFVMCLHLRMRGFNRLSAGGDCELLRGSRRRRAALVVKLRPWVGFRGGLRLRKG
jgi:hypothetical protein